MSLKAIKEAVELLAEDPAENLATLLAARDEIEALERAAQYAAYGRIPGVPAEQKHFMDTMLAIADEAKGSGS